MELKFYTNLHAFKLHYLEDFNDHIETDNFLSYLRKLLEGYKILSAQESDRELYNCNAEVLRQLKPEEAADYYLGIRAKHNKIVEFVEGLIDIEKINFLRFQENNKKDDEVNTVNHHSESESLYDWFDNVRTGSLGDYEIFKKLKLLSENYDIELLKMILKDLEFYLFIEKEKMESKFTWDEMQNVIDERIKKGIDIPYQKSFLSPDTKILKKEELLFPYEFFTLYQLKNTLVQKINNFKSETPENELKGETFIIQQKNQIDINLLKYLSENFSSTDKRFNELTKYNQIYRFLNEGRDYNIEHRAYKNLIKELFHFDYLNREIKGETPKHLTQLENLSLIYYNSKK